MHVCRASPLQVWLLLTFQAIDPQTEMKHRPLLCIHILNSEKCYIYIIIYSICYILYAIGDRFFTFHTKLCKHMVVH